MAARWTLVGIVLRFHGQPDFAFLEAVQNFRDSDGVDAFVIDGAQTRRSRRQATITPPLRPGSVSRVMSSKRPVFQSRR